MPRVEDNGLAANSYHYDASMVAGSAMHGKACQAPVGMPYETRMGSRGNMPDIQEVTQAVKSLYDDLLKPYGRILRKRLAERAAEQDLGTVDVDIRRLKSLCESCPWLSVQTEDGGDWSVLLRDSPHKFANIFVDVYSPTDIYPVELWNAVAQYFEHVAEPEMMLPGGRYSCAQALRSRNLPFLVQYRLGQVCHIVQLAISQKKILGYLNGAVVPYKRSQSMVKERCAERGRPCANAARGTSELATWETARNGLQEILGGCSSAVPLSNIKRLFRSRFRIELSETALGHAKLSELLQDERLNDICAVRLHGHGYVVVPQMPSKLPVGQQRFAPQRRMSAPVPSAQQISLSDKLMPHFDARRGSAPDEIHSAYGLSGAQAVAQLAASRNGHPPPQLLAPAAGYPQRMMAGTPITQPTPAQDAAVAAVLARHAAMPYMPQPVPRVPEGFQQDFSRWNTEQRSAGGASGNMGSVGLNVNNTFIHSNPTLSPPPGHNTQPARSQPRDSGPDQNPGEALVAAVNYASHQSGQEGESGEAAFPQAELDKAVGGPLPAGPFPTEALGSTLSTMETLESECPQCSNVFLPDEKFCRMCGKKRMPLVAVTSSSIELNEAMVSGLAARRQFRPDPFNIAEVQREKNLEPEYVIPSPELSPKRPKEPEYVVPSPELSPVRSRAAWSRGTAPSLGGMFGKPPSDLPDVPALAMTQPEEMRSSPVPSAPPAYLDEANLGRGMMVRNTFIHAVTQPESPSPHPKIRSNSLPRNMAMGMGMGGSSDDALSLGAALYSAGFARGRMMGEHQGRDSYEFDGHGYEDSLRDASVGAYSVPSTASPQRSPSPRRKSALFSHLLPKNVLPPEPALSQQPNGLPAQHGGVPVRLSELV